MLIILSLKTDLEAADDKKLATRELSALAAAPIRQVSHVEAARLLKLGRISSDWSKRTLFTCDIDPAKIDRLRKRLAFWDTIHWREDGAGIDGTASRVVDGIASCLTVSCVLESTVRLKGSEEVAAQVLGRLNIQLAPKMAGTNSAGLPSPAVRKKNDYLSHPLHKYKAKFFPRLARSLVNIVCPDDDAVIFDPFSGSGTAILESSIMGLQGTGFDLDPLSVFIGKVKCELEEIDSVSLADARDSVSNAVKKGRQLDLFSKSKKRTPKSKFKVPEFLIARNPVRFPKSDVTQFEAETNKFIDIIMAGYDGVVRDWLLLALSHALSTKVSLRWMGTGDNRFALEIAKRSLSSIFLSQLNVMVEKAQVYHALRKAKVLPLPAPTKFLVHDATKASPLKARSVDGIVTSPPYLPAASGRETYLRSRAISLVALGLLTEEQVLEREKNIIGSILAAPKLGKNAVPMSVQNLTSWMRGQRARDPKALPTVAYFENLAASLREMGRVLRAGARAAIVVSKYHRFYELVSRKVVWEFDMSAAVAEVASDPKYKVGLIVDEIIDLELSKMDYVARPGAKGSYHESIVFLRRP